MGSNTKVIAGKPVVDAKKPVMLEITTRDLKEGRKRKPDCCVAAEACKRQFHAKRAIVHLSRVYVEEPKRWIRYVTPKSLRTEIVAFDRGADWNGVGEYRLTPFHPSQALGTSRKSGGSGRDKNPGSHPTRGRRLRNYNNKTLGVRHKAKLGIYV